MHRPDEHQQGKEGEHQEPYWEDGILRWPDGTPMTNEDLGRFFPTTQIVPHEPEPRREVPRRRKEIKKIWN